MQMYVDIVHVHNCILTEIASLNFPVYFLNCLKWNEYLELSGRKITSVFQQYEYNL